MTSPAVGNSRPNPERSPCGFRVTGAHSLFTLVPPNPVEASLEGCTDNCPLLSEPSPVNVDFTCSVPGLCLSVACSAAGETPGDGRGDVLAQPAEGAPDKAPIPTRDLEALTEVSLALVNLCREEVAGLGETV